MSEFEQRLARLERSCARWRAACVLAVAGCGLALLLGAGKDEPKMLRTQMLALVAPDGQPRMVLSAAQDQPYLKMNAKKGGSSLSLLIDPDGEPNIALFDGNGKMRMTLGLDKDGVPTQTLSDATGNPRLALTVPGKNEPMLRMFDEKRAVLFRLP
jgi:hypothetical protein